MLVQPGVNNNLLQRLLAQYHGSNNREVTIMELCKHINNKCGLLPNRETSIQGYPNVLKVRPCMYIQCTVYMCTSLNLISLISNLLCFTVQAYYNYYTYPFTIYRNPFSVSFYQDTEMMVQTYWTL